MRSLRFRALVPAYFRVGEYQVNFCGGGSHILLRKARERRRKKERERERVRSRKPSSLSRCGNIYSRRYTQESLPPQIRGFLMQHLEQPVLMVNITLRIIERSALSGLRTLLIAS